MPTFFGRRYQRPREQVSGTEKGLGVFLLILMAGVVVALAITVRLPITPLFQLLPGTNLVKPDPQWVVARSMMPALGTAGWSEMADIEVVSPDDLPADSPDAILARSYGVLAVYRGAYVSTAGLQQRVAVTICDMGDPARAFGLYHATRPDGAEPLYVGCGGWQDGDTGAFWAGRYYTRFDRSTVQDADPTLQTIADALAGVQLRYGPPFWAEAVLPAAGRAADSFRFVPQKAGGFDFLADAFLADYDQGVTAFVTKCRDAARADVIVGRFQEYLEQHGRVQARPAPPESPLLAGDVEGEQLAVFAVNNRVYGVLGTDMEPVSALVKTMIAAARPSVSAVAAAAAPAAAQASLPDALLDGWGLPADIRVFTPENLWEKINGRADIYLAYRMADMTFGTYRSERDPEQFVDVYQYDMGSPDNAFGIYRAELPPDPDPIDVGREGYATPGGVFFWKGQHYVRVEAADVNAVLAAAAEAVARAIGKNLAGSDQPLWADAILPTADRVEGKFEYHASDAFSLDFLSDVFSAEYAVDGATFQTFIHRGEDAAAAKRVFDAYRVFFTDYGSILREESGEGYEVVIGDSGGIIDAVFVKGRYLGGVSGCPNADLAAARCVSFATAIEAD